MELEYGELPFLKRVFQLPTRSSVDFDVSRIGSLASDTNVDSDYLNNFHDIIVYRNPSQKAFETVDWVIENQNPYDVTNIQFTSGTTGLPKAAALTHHSLINNAINMSKIMEMVPEDRYLVMVPFYHCMGMVCGNLNSLSSGSAIVIPSPTFNAKKSLEAVEKHKCTTAIGVPTMFIEMIREVGLKSYDLGNLHKSFIAGSICPEQLIKDMSEKLGLWRTHIGYGMTETAPITFMIRKEHPIEKQSTTVGTIMDNLEARILDPEGNPVPMGEVGEYAVKGYAVMPGYYNDPVNTAKTIQNEWLMSGDLAKFDEEGFLIIEGRIKDLIIRGGENISPKEIEEFVMAMPEVEIIQVIGVPDPKFQEEICAWIKLKAGATLKKEDIVTYLKPKISHFKIPKYVKFVERFPITVTGKTRKVEMIKEWVDETENMSEEDLRSLYMVR